MRDPRAHVVLSRLDLSDVVNGILDFRFDHAVAVLDGEPEAIDSLWEESAESPLEDYTGVSSDFKLLRSSQFESLRESFNTKLGQTGLDLELVEQIEPETESIIAVPEFLIVDGRQFCVYLEQLTNANVTDGQKNSLHYVLCSISQQVGTAYNFHDPSDTRSHELLMCLGEIHKAVSSLRDPLFQPHGEFLLLIATLLRNRCLNPVVHAARSGAFSLDDIKILDSGLALRQKDLEPACMRWYSILGTADAFSLMWNLLIDAVEPLKEAPLTRQLYVETLSVLRAALVFAKNDIVPNSSIPDCKNADQEFRAVIDETFDRLAQL